MAQNEIGYNPEAGYRP